MIKFNKLTKKTVFTVERPDAKTICLAGEFNGWNTQSHPMAQDKKGVWKIDLALEPGTYQFRYFVDQSWWMNDAEAGQVANEHGSNNSLTVVEFLKRAPRTAAAKKTSRKTTNKTVKKSSGRPRKK